MTNLLCSFHFGHLCPHCSYWQLFLQELGSLALHWHCGHSIWCHGQFSSVLSVCNRRNSNPEFLKILWTPVRASLLLNCSDCIPGQWLSEIRSWGRRPSISPSMVITTSHRTSCWSRCPKVRTNTGIAQQYSTATPAPLQHLQHNTRSFTPLLNAFWEKREEGNTPHFEERCSGPVIHGRTCVHL